MNIRIPIILAAILSCGLSFAQTAEDAYRIAYMVVHSITSSDEWRDCYDGKFRNSPPGPYYPTIESALESLSNTVYSSWSLEKRQRAFDMFLERTVDDDGSENDQERVYVAKYALKLSKIKGYTNSLAAAKSILRSSTSRYKMNAVDIVTSFMSPSDEMTDLIYSSSTNYVDVNEQYRYKVVFRYARALRDLTQEQFGVVSNAANLFYRNRVHIENLMSVDEILKHAYPSYAASSNRLILCNTALSRPGLIPHDIAYYSAITNELANAPQPLGGVPELDADSDESETE